MPNCFQLRKKDEREPEVLQKVDEAICERFGWEVHPEHWAWNWYNVIGFLIAMGNELGSVQLREKVRDWYREDLYGEEEATERRRESLKILAFLEEHYESTSWVEIGKR